MTRHFIEVKGRHGTWMAFIKDNQVSDMRADGFEVFEIHSTIPHWVAAAGLSRPWCALQDIWDFPSRALRWIR